MHSHTATGYNVDMVMNKRHTDVYEQMYSCMSRV